jgi:hypothetical protein
MPGSPRASGMSAPYWICSECRMPNGGDLGPMMIGEPGRDWLNMEKAHEG